MALKSNLVASILGTAGAQSEVIIKSETQSGFNEDPLNDDADDHHNDCLNWAANGRTLITAMKANYEHL